MLLVKESPNFGLSVKDKICVSYFTKEICKLLATAGSAVSCNKFAF